MSIPAGHHVMQLPQPTQEDRPNCWIDAAILCVNHCRYRDRIVGLILPPCTCENSTAKHESHTRVRVVASPFRSLWSTTVLQKQVGHDIVQFPHDMQRNAIMSQ